MTTAGLSSEVAQEVDVAGVRHGVTVMEFIRRLPPKTLSSLDIIDEEDLGRFRKCVAARKCKKTAVCRLRGVCDLIRPDQSEPPLYGCRCSRGYAGLSCESIRVDQSHCKDVKCLHGGSCDKPEGADKEVCLCQPGYWGKRCQRRGEQPTTDAAPEHPTTVAVAKTSHPLKVATGAAKSNDDDEQGISRIEAEKKFVASKTLKDSAPPMRLEQTTLGSGKWRCRIDIVFVEH